MDILNRSVLRRLGIRAKLIALFVVIKVVPLVLLALLAWGGVARLGSKMAERTDQLTSDVRNTVAGMGADFGKEAVKALDDRAREELERLTTDTARAVADFLYDRDRDILLVARLEPQEASYRAFIASRLRNLTDSGQWQLDAEGKQWVSKSDGGPDLRRNQARQPYDDQRRVEVVEG